jgi:hypothetical protein
MTAEKDVTMFGGFGAARYSHQFRDAKKTEGEPVHELTLDQYVEAVVAGGGDEKEARRTAKIASILGGVMVVGDKRFRITK